MFPVPDTQASFLKLTIVKSDKTVRKKKIIQMKYKIILYMSASKDILFAKKFFQKIMI